MFCDLSFHHETAIPNLIHFKIKLTNLPTSIDSRNREMLGRQWAFRGLVRSAQLRAQSQCQPRYGFQHRFFSSSPPPVPSQYRVIIHTTLNTKKKAITQVDILKLFGAFDPYNIEVSTEKSEEGKGEEATIRFKVPRLRSVKEIKDSFSGNESLGSRMKIEAEKEVWPVLMMRLPVDMDAESLRRSLDGEGGKSGEKTNKVSVQPYVFSVCE